MYRRRPMKVSTQPYSRAWLRTCSRYVVTAWEVAEVRVNERVRILAAHARVARETEVAQAVHDAEVDDLGDAAHVRRDILRSHRVDLGRGAAMDVLAALERGDELGLAGDVRQHPQLHLRVVGAHQTLPGVGMERAADPLSPLRSHRDVLQVRVR